MFGATNIVKYRDKNWAYRGYGIVFYGAGSWKFGNDFVKNTVSFGVGNSLSC